ncbi:MAG: PAS domain-containing protein [Saprospiraceae bacterium]|nr:PAS domain-containing protein [Saprospiraceae bacterium]
MKKISKTISTFIGLSHLEYQTYDFFHRKIICSSGLAQKVLGYTEQEFVKLSNNFYETLIHPDDLDAINETVDKIINSSQGEIIENTSRFKKSDGSYIWVYTRKTVIERDSKGNPTIICTVAEDITEFIVLNEQLKARIKQLNEVSWKNSHLLRAPVAIIIGLVDLIEEKEITSQHNIQVFSYLKQAVEKLDAVIHEINETAKP